MTAVGGKNYLERKKLFTVAKFKIDGFRPEQEKII